MESLIYFFIQKHSRGAFVEVLCAGTGTGSTSKGSDTGPAPPSPRPAERQALMSSKLVVVGTTSVYKRYVPRGNMTGTGRGNQSLSCVPVAAVVAGAARMYSAKYERSHYYNAMRWER